MVAVSASEAERADDTRIGKLVDGPAGAISVEERQRRPLTLVTG